jgi:surface antigen
LKRLASALVLFGLCLAPPTANSGGSGIRLWSNVTKADTVGIRVNLGGFPNEECEAEIRKGHLSARVPRSVRTSRNGGARWSWQVPGNIDRGMWTFHVTCAGGRRIHKASTSFIADAGIGAPSKGLWIRKSMHAEAVRQPSAPKGNGGGGKDPLYPVGQCTWWVALHRPDLPFFRGAAGDALNWAKSAAEHGFLVGTTPAVGAVAVFQPNQYRAGRYGHVALVTAINGEKITISEANFRARAKNDTRTIDSSGLQFIYRKGNPPPLPQVSLDTPGANAILHGTVPVSAKSNAPAIRFAAYSYSNPAFRTSGHWQILGDDTTPGDGFSTSWDTTSIPNQGGPGGSSVIVSAVALDGNGSPTDTHSEVRVNVANSRSAGGQTFYPYYVVSTCDEGECGLHLRAGPGYTSYAITGKKYDGEEVDVVCQAHGETFTSEHGGSSDVWDRLTSGDWVSDFFVDTAERGALSPPIPLCT